MNKSTKHSFADDMLPETSFNHMLVTYEKLTKQAVYVSYKF